MSEAAAAPAPQVDSSAAPVDGVATPNAAAPAAPATPAPLNVDAPKAPPTPVPDDTVVVQYTPTGDASLDVALQFVGNLGYGPEHAGIQAAQKGDFTALEAALKDNPKAKGYEPFLRVAKESFQRTVDTRKAKEDATQAAVIDAVGGADNWNALHAWIVAEADEDQKTAINAAFSQGGFAATSMANQLAQLYSQSGASQQKPKAAVKDTASRGGSEASGKLDGPAYRAEVRKLEAKYGYRLTETSEYAALSARFLAGRKS